ncbi:MAG: hypothetical protein ABL928_08195 [Sphingorhabdus sp.]
MGKLVYIFEAILAFLFAPVSKWYELLKLLKMIPIVWMHETKQGSALGDQLLNTVTEEFCTKETLVCFFFIIAHVCWGNIKRRNERKSGILPMRDEPRWRKWLRRIALLTRH